MTGQMPPYSLDDPAWDTAADAYLTTDIRAHLRTLGKAWDDDLADHLLFSALLHQDTVYPATFLALPHIITLHDDAPEVTALRARLGPTDPTTNALLLNFRAIVACPACGWQGPPPDPRLPT